MFDSLILRATLLKYSVRSVDFNCSNSPVYIDESCDIGVTTKRLLWGKWINLGQTCIAPDYIMCTKKTEIALIKEATKIMTEWYGKNWRASSDLPRIINDRNFARLKGILDRTEGWYYEFKLKIF